MPTRTRTRTRPPRPGRLLLWFIGLAACVGWMPSGVSVGGVIQSVYVSSPDGSAILRGTSVDSLQPFVSSPGDTPTGLVAGSNGVLFAGFAGSNEVRAYGPDGGLLWATSTGALAPAGLALDIAGTLLVVEQGDSGGVLARLGQDGHRIGGLSPLDGPYPNGIAVDVVGRTFTNDLADGLFRRADTGERFQFLGDSTTAIASSPSGTLVLTLTGTANSLVSFDYDTRRPSLLTDLGSFQPQGLAVNLQSQILVSGFDGDTGMYAVRLYSPMGELLGSSQDDLLNPTFMATGAWVVPEPRTFLMGLIGMAVWAGGLYRISLRSR